jgi:hypothetical protein
LECLCRRGHIGTINEDTEELARCAALSKYGISAEEFEAQEAAGSPVNGMPPGWVFHVTPA